MATSAPATTDFPKRLGADHLKILRAHPHLYPPAGTVITDPNTYGLCIGPGWYPLVARLSAVLEAMIVELPEPGGYYAVQVKQKYGELRFYMNHSTVEMDEAIEKAEEESRQTCERCGKEGELCDDRGWWTTVCEDVKCRGNAVPTGEVESGAGRSSSEEEEG